VAAAVQVAGEAFTPAQVTKARKALGMTQRELSLRLGIDTGTVSRWERGVQRCDGSAATALRMLAAAGVKGAGPQKRGRKPNHQA